MIRIMLKSKISGAEITELKLYYQGSITIDQDILEAADLREGERVDVLNLNTGARIQTYCISGEKGSGEVCLNGPAARCGYPGDKVIIISYAGCNEEELDSLKSRYVELHERNRIKNSYLAREGSA